LPTLAVEFHYPASLHVIQNLKSNGELGSNSYTLIGGHLKLISKASRMS
jgi:hypothetical protein